MLEMEPLVAGLVASCRTGEVFSPGKLPDTYSAAESAQDEMLARLGWKGGGWKLGASNYGARERLNLSRPFAGLIRRENILPSRTTRPVGLFRQPGAECELTAVLGSDLPARPQGYTREEIVAAVARMTVGIEIPQTRYSALGVHGGLALVADNGAAGYAIVGEGGEAGGAGIDDLDRRGRLFVDGALRADGGVEQLVAAPSVLLRDHVNRLGRRGWEHARGDVVLLGALAPWVALDRACHVVASIDGLGEAELTLED